MTESTLLYEGHSRINDNDSITLSHLSLDIGKHNDPRCDGAERGVLSGAILFA